MNIYPPTNSLVPTLSTPEVQQILSTTEVPHQDDVMWKFGIAIKKKQTDYMSIVNYIAKIARKIVHLGLFKMCLCGLD